MLTITDLSKAYGGQVLFSSADLAVHRRERVGLVGRNGHGKSTLLKMILEEEETDSGLIKISDGYRVGRLSQHIHFELDTVLAEVEQVLPVHDDSWRETHLAEAVLQGLGFNSEMMAAHPSTLSGGYQIRINLAKLLVSEADLLLLDEPTNYLDIVSIRWLSNFLRTWKGELILITHDRGFMDDVVTHIAGIHRCKIRKIPGNTQKFYSQISLEEDVHEQTRVNQQKQREDAEAFIKRFRAKASKAKAVQSRVKALEKQGQLEKLENIEDLEFAFKEAPFQGKHMMDVRGLSFGYDEPLMSDLNFTIGKRDRIAVIGPNGKGKSTLLRLLARELTPDAGELSASMHTKPSYFGQTNVSRLDPKRTVEEEVISAMPEYSRSGARGICGLMMFSGDHALKKISVLSGGEKSRVLLGKVLAAPANLLLLDEPTNHLDMTSSEALTKAIQAFDGAAVIVTHDEGMLRRLAKRLIIFDRGKVTLYEGTYDDFLQRVGWQDEPTNQPVKNGDSGGMKFDKKQLRKLRSDINKRRTDELSPLKKQIRQIEKEITSLEQMVEERNTALIEASKDGYGDAEAKMSREIHTARAKIEELFEELEVLTKEHDEKEAQFEQELAAF